LSTSIGRSTHQVRRRTNGRQIFRRGRVEPTSSEYEISCTVTSSGVSSSYITSGSLRETNLIFVHSRPLFSRPAKPEGSLTNLHSMKTHFRFYLVKSSVNGSHKRATYIDVVQHYSLSWNVPLGSDWSSIMAPASNTLGTTCKFLISIGRWNACNKIQ
jgi:hypothetical protein